MFIENETQIHELIGQFVWFVGVSDNQLLTCICKHSLLFE